MIVRWWGYMYSFFGVTAIINAVLVVVAAENSGGIAAAIRHVLQEPNTGTPFVVLFLALGPLFNVYVAVVSAKQAVEADDDFFHFNDEFDLPVLPTPAERKRLIFTLSMLTGLVLLPFTVWLYTATVDSLWRQDLPLYVQPGVIVSLVLVLSVYFLMPRLFPGAAQHLSEIEDVLTSRIEREFDED